MKLRKGDLVSVDLARSQDQIYMVTDVRPDSIGGSALRMEKHEDGWRRVHVEDEVRDEVLVVSHDLAHMTWMDSCHVHLVSRADEEEQ